MKQILQNLKTGATEIAEVPCPRAGRGQLLIRSSCTLISAGTERLLVDFGKAGWLEKARQQPEKVMQVLDKLRTDGVIPTVEAIFTKLGEPMPLGYCNAGVVLEVGAGIHDLQPGDRVASNGPHAEVVCVPRHLCAKIPDEVMDEEAAFTVLGSIALQCIRLARPTLGERFMVFGLGLVGLLTVQLLRANGCAVLAVDASKKRLQLAESAGAKTVDLSKGADPLAAAKEWTRGLMVDGVLIAASAKGDDIVHQAAQACRKRGRIVLVGVADLNLKRSDFYEKELTFQVSCSYGPGRYDENYEQAGHDYPLGFVRWTEQRNFEAVLDAMRTGHLQVKELVTNRFPMEEAQAVYDKVLHDSETLGIIIEYPSNESRDTSLSLSKPINNLILQPAGSVPSVGIIGAGNYARSTLLPVLSRTRVNLAAVADINGVVAAHAAWKYGAGRVVSDYRSVLDDPNIQVVFVLVGHHLHARFVCEALEARKHVFVEKPLAINETGLSQVLEATARVPDRHLMIGFNRRFSPHIAKIRELLEGRSGPLCMSMMVNAGFINPEHWTQDPERGGGRIIGEGCHFIDLMVFLTGFPVTAVSAMMAGSGGCMNEDLMTIVLGFADGSVGTVHYFANGSKGYPKENMEIFTDGRVIRMENFRITTGYGFKRFRSFRTWRQDKGHQEEIRAFIERVENGGIPLISLDSIVNVTQASFAAVESAKSGQTIRL